MSDQQPLPIHDPDLYERMCKPRPQEEINASLHAFWQELSALREKHGIRDLVCVTTFAAIEDGKRDIQVRVGYRGASELKTLIAARALGILREIDKQEIDKLAGEKPAAPKRGRKKLCTRSAKRAASSRPSMICSKPCPPAAPLATGPR